jgi:membrane-associated phospholipid phosphatase
MKNFIVVCCLCVVTLLLAVFVDVPVALWLRQHQCSMVLESTNILEELGKSHWLLIPCLFGMLYFWKQHRNPWNNPAAILCYSVAGSGIIANVIKVIVCRPRPIQLFEHNSIAPRWFEFIVDFEWNSFPSGHATTGLSFAFVCSHYWPRYKAMWYTLGIAVAMSRVIKTAHYCSDVFFGSAIGIAVAWAAIVHLGNSRVAEHIAD